MRTTLLALLISCTLTSCSPSSLGSASVAEAEVTLNLWGKADYGMTVAEIKKAYSSALEPAEPLEVLDSLGLLILKNVEIADKKFNAEFYFDKHTRKLDRVTLTAQGDLTAEQTYHLFDKLQVLLSEKYGRAVSQSDREEREIRMKSRHWVWIENGREISLLNSEFDRQWLGMDNSRGILINFQRVNPARTENL